MSGVDAPLTRPRPARASTRLGPFRASNLVRSRIWAANGLGKVAATFARMRSHHQQVANKSNRRPDGRAQLLAFGNLLLLPEVAAVAAK